MEELDIQKISGMLKLLGQLAEHQIPTTPKGQLEMYLLVSNIKQSLPEFKKLCDALGSRPVSTALERVEIYLKIHDQSLQRYNELLLSSNPVDVTGLPLGYDESASRRSATMGSMETNCESLRRHLNDLESRFYDETGGAKFYVPTSDTSAYLSKPFDGWDAVTAWMPTMAKDIECASLCLAMSQPTATVFHLARIGEHGLRKVCIRYIPVAKLPPPHKAMMGKYIDAIDKFSNVAPHLMPIGAAELAMVVPHFARIKNVWRDRISHEGVYYDESEAKRCYNAIRDGLTECANITWPR